MKFACTRCGSRQWPDPDSSCPLCNDGREEPTEALGDPLEAQEQAIKRFMADGCKEYSASYWWAQIDEQTDKELTPDIMAESLALCHDDACVTAWQDLETAPSSSAWADVCALAGFDICKNHNQKQ